MRARSSVGSVRPAHGMQVKVRMAAGVILLALCLFVYFNVVERHTIKMVEIFKKNVCSKLNLFTLENNCCIYRDKRTNVSIYPIMIKYISNDTM